jgi:hypothetical protein
VEEERKKKRFGEMEEDERKKMKEMGKKIVILVPGQVIMPLIHLMPTQCATCLQENATSAFL